MNKSSDSTLFSTGEDDSPGVPCPVLAMAFQERCGQLAKAPEKNNENS